MASRRELRALITIAGRIDPSLQTAMLRASGESARLARNSARTASGLNRITGAVTGQITALAGSLAAVLGVQKIIDTADAWTTVRSRVGLVTDGIQQQKESLDAVFEIAQKTKQSYQATGDLYSKIAMNAKQLHLANNQVLQITDTVNKALRVGGGTTQQNEAAIMQFSQSLASGRLQGDELRSILENAPRLAKAVADGLGVTVGSLKKFGSEGALTSDVVIAALQSQGKVIDQEFAKMPVTIRGAFTYFDNAFGKFLDDTGQRTNIFSRISSGMVRGTDALFLSLERLGNSEKVANAFTTMGNGIQWARDNSNWLIPVVESLTYAYATHKAVIIATAIAQRAHNIATIASSGLIAAQCAWIQYQTVVAGGGSRVIGLITAAQWLWNAAMTANPIGTVVVAIAGLIAIGVALWKNWDWLMAKGKEFFNWLGKTGGSIKSFFGFGGESNTTPTPQPMPAHYALGGIATRPSIFGEAGPEMAIPLERTSRSYALLQQTARILGVNGPKGSQTLKEGPIGNTRSSLGLLERSINRSLGVGNQGGEIKITYAPNIQGGGSDVKNALDLSFEQFKIWAEEYFGDKGRVVFD